MCPFISTFLRTGLVLNCMGFAGTVLAEEDLTSLRIESVVLRPLREAEVPAQQTGQLLEIVAGEGTRVQKGQLLAVLDDRDAQLQAKQAQLEHAQAKSKASNRVHIEYAEKALEVARAELRRSSDSIEKFAKSISQSQLDVEQLTVEKLLLERKQAEHELTLDRYAVQLRHTELAAAELRLEQHQVRAPFAGTVALVRGRVGEWVEVGSAVLRLVAVDRLRAEGFVDAEHVRTTWVGRPVKFLTTVADHDVVAEGVIRFVSPEMDPVTRQLRIWAEVPHAEGQLRPGQQGVLELVP